MEVGVPQTLPQRPDLEQLTSLARELQRAYNAGEYAARQRFAQHLPAAIRRQQLVSGRPQALLTQAQTVLAREYGFASWPLLRQHVLRVRAEIQADMRQVVSTSPTGRQQRIALRAERLAGAAEQGDLEAVCVALRIGGRDGDAVRALLVEQGRFATVIDALLTGVAHPSARVRFLTAQAMDHWADERCAAPLSGMLYDPVPRVRWAALHSLQCAACKLAPLSTTPDLTDTVVTLALTDPSIKVRRVAAWELGQLCPDPRAVAALEQLCAQETDLTVLRNARLGLSRQRAAG
jgi:hypothetical protein